MPHRRHSDLGRDGEINEVHVNNQALSAGQVPALYIPGLAA